MMSKKRKKEKKKILNTSKVQKVVKCSHIYNVFKFKSTLSTCSSSKVPFLHVQVQKYPFYMFILNIYTCWRSFVQTINIMLYQNLDKNNSDFGISSAPLISF